MSKGSQGVINAVLIGLSIAISLIAAETRAGKTIIVDEKASLIAQMSEQGEIIPNNEIKRALINLLGKWLVEPFQKNGFSYRLSDYVKSWTFFEDRGFVVIMGTVARNEQLSYFFVWVLRLNSAEVDSIYLSVGGRVIEGKEYPSGIIPHTSFWDNLRALSWYSLVNFFKNPAGVYSASYLLESGNWKKLEYDFRDKGMLILTQTEWVESVEGSKYTLSQKTGSGTWRTARGVVLVDVANDGIESKGIFHFSGNDLLGDISTGRRRFRPEP